MSTLPTNTTVEILGDFITDIASGKSTVSDLSQNMGAVEEIKHTLVKSDKPYTIAFIRCLRTCLKTNLKDPEFHEVRMNGRVLLVSMYKHTLAAIEDSHLHKQAWLDAIVKLEPGDTTALTKVLSDLL